MKTNKLFGLAVLVCGFAVSFTSCTNDDNPVSGGLQKKTISFENQALNSNGFWIGEAKGNSYTYSDDWGGTTTTFTDNAYIEEPITFPVTYSLYSSSYGDSDFWSGFAVSNRTETSFDAATITPDQYNNVTGKAHTGSNFCVVCTYGESINVNSGKPTFVNGFWYTNSAYAANSMEKGDYYAGAKFDKTDWFKCTVVGKKQGGGTVKVDIDLAKDGEYVKEWKYCDLSKLGKVTELSFEFSGSRSNEKGVLTPAYICIDDIEIEY